MAFCNGKCITIATYFKNIFKASTISMNHKVGCEFKFQISIAELMRGVS